MTTVIGSPVDSTMDTGLAGMLAHYTRHTVVTDPGPHADALRALPTDVATLVDLIGGVFAHYEFDLPGTGFRPAPDRLADVDARTVPAILDRIFARDPRPLTEPRPLDRRYLGVCRDASLLLTAILRAQGVPARLRYGSVHYLYLPQRPMHDHVWVEYWDAAQGRWRYGDGRMYGSVRRAHGLPDRLRDDVPPELFRTGGAAWLHSQESDAAAFRLSGFMLNADAGRWQARNLFLYDLASLAGWEPLMWDAWGYIRRAKPRTRPRGPLQYRKLNRLAALDPQDPGQWRELLRVYRSQRLVRVPARVLCCSPVGDRHTVSAPAARQDSAPSARQRTVPDAGH